MKKVETFPFRKNNIKNEETHRDQWSEANNVFLQRDWREVHALWRGMYVPQSPDTGQDIINLM